MTLSQQILTWAEDGAYPPSQGTLIKFAAMAEELEKRLEPIAPQPVEKQD